MGHQARSQPHPSAVKLSFDGPGLRHERVSTGEEAAAAQMLGTLKQISAFGEQAGFDVLSHEETPAVDVDGSARPSHEGAC